MFQKCRLKMDSLWSIYFFKAFHLKSGLGRTYSTFSNFTSELFFSGTKLFDFVYKSVCFCRTVPIRCQWPSLEWRTGFFPCCGRVGLWTCQSDSSTPPGPMGGASGSPGSLASPTWKKKRSKVTSRWDWDFQGVEMEAGSIFFNAMYLLQLFMKVIISYNIILKLSVLNLNSGHCAPSLCLNVPVSSYQFMSSICTPHTSVLQLIFATLSSSDNGFSKKHLLVQKTQPERGKKNPNKQKKQWRNRRRASIAWTDV